MDRSEGKDGLRVQGQKFRRSGTVSKQFIEENMFDVQNHLNSNKMKLGVKERLLVMIKFLKLNNALSRFTN